MNVMSSHMILYIFGDFSREPHMILYIFGDFSRELYDQPTNGQSLLSRCYGAPKKRFNLQLSSIINDTPIS